EGEVLAPAPLPHLLQDPKDVSQARHASILRVRPMTLSNSTQPNAQIPRPTSVESLTNSRLWWSAWSLTLRSVPNEKRRPSCATAYGWKLPGFESPVRKSGCGTVAVK